jgi:hypothetical protein
MIKFLGPNGIKGVPVIGLGIDEENVRRLKEGMPILIDPEEVEKLFGVKAEILIFYGTTRQSMIQDLKEAEILPLDLKIE